jgi:hypothetical protein
VNIEAGVLGMNIYNFIAKDAMEMCMEAMFIIEPGFLAGESEGADKSLVHEQSQGVIDGGLGDGGEEGRQGLMNFPDRGVQGCSGQEFEDLESLMGGPDIS